ncbi:MAG: ssDNA-binding domain-containing protein [Deltaproteobacteria bacterium]|nr:ssDNA-binding domain-containing protein [Deltaproteobacteria bacterium]
MSPTASSTVTPTSVLAPAQAATASPAPVPTVTPAPPPTAPSAPTTSPTPSPVAAASPAGAATSAPSVAPIAPPAPATAPPPTPTPAPPASQSAALTPAPGGAPTAAAAEAPTTSVRPAAAAKPAPAASPAPAEAPSGPRVLLANRMIWLLRESSAPWQKPWNPLQSVAPFNPTSGTVYRGINRIALIDRGYQDPRWITFKQAQKAGFLIKKGARASSIEFFQWKEKTLPRDEAGLPLRSPSGELISVKVEFVRPLIRFFRVFNYAELTDRDGEPLPPFEPIAPSWDPIAKVEEIMLQSGAKFIHDQRNKAFYSSRDDAIHLPPKASFPDQEGYYSTALHELAHWTRHEDRLGRRGDKYGTAEYAREELRAEIASWMVAIDLNLRYYLGDHASYASHWISMLEKNPNELFRATAEAEKIKNYILAIIDFKPSPPTLEEEGYRDEPPEERAPLPRAMDLSFPELNSQKDGGADFDFSLEDGPRETLVSCVFGRLLSPGLLSCQEERWQSVLGLIGEAKAREWTRSYPLNDFFHELRRVGALALRWAKLDQEKEESDDAREIRAYNAVLTLLFFARRNRVVKNLPLPPMKGAVPNYMAVSARRRKKGEEEFPFQVGGAPLHGYVLETNEALATRFCVIDLDNVEILAAFHAARNAKTLAAALNGPEELYLGEGARLKEERLRLLSGQAPDVRENYIGSRRDDAELAESARKLDLFLKARAAEREEYESRVHAFAEERRARDAAAPFVFPPPPKKVLNAPATAGMEAIFRERARAEGYPDGPAFAGDKLDWEKERAEDYAKLKELELRRLDGALSDLIREESRSYSYRWLEEIRFPDGAGVLEEERARLMERFAEIDFTDERLLSARIYAVLLESKMIKDPLGALARLYAPIREKPQARASATPPPAAPRPRDAAAERLLGQGGEASKDVAAPPKAAPRGPENAAE